MKHKRSTDAIVSLVKKKREETVQKVDQAIQQLTKEIGRINFNSVSCSKECPSLTCITS
ncbi:hypothetical protein ACFO25_00950 [Paenactinomyces guangxiensis]|uniref:hypothetical protein n=1 Tax=Paenactinomyces guangxiensis TaxID=1490290 RepID=UPI001E53D96B|nr:hypothetical protein [Paenactinomyces guangxiensis]